MTDQVEKALKVAEQSKDDIYSRLSEKIYDYKIGCGSKERQVSKSAVLGLGFRTEMRNGRTD